MPHDLVITSNLRDNIMNSVPNQFCIGNENNRKYRCNMIDAMYAVVKLQSR